MNKSRLIVIIILLLIGTMTGALTAEGTPSSPPVSGPGSERAWQLRWDHGKQVRDLYLLERDGGIVAGFFYGTDAMPHWTMSTANLTVAADGTLSGAFTAQRQPDHISRLKAKVANPTRPWKELQATATGEITAHMDGNTVTGSIRLTEKMERHLTTEASLYGMRVELPTFKDGLIELLPQGVIQFAKVQTGNQGVAVGMLVRMIVRDGRVTTASVTTLGSAQHAPVALPTPTCVPVTPLGGSRLQAVIQVGGKDAAEGPVGGTLTLSGMLIGDRLAGTARWEGTDGPLDTHFLGRVSRSRYLPPLHYENRQWTAPTLPEPDQALITQAAREALTPITVTGPDGQPTLWWNRLLARNKRNGFIYAPILAYNPVAGAARYRYDVTPVQEGTQTWSFEAREPRTSLAAIWEKLPLGRPLKIVVTALAADGKEIGPALTPEQQFGEAGPRKGWEVDKWPPKVIAPAPQLVFQRKAAFQGPYGESLAGARERAMQMARYMINLPQLLAYWGLTLQGNDIHLESMNSGESGAFLNPAGLVHASVMIARHTDDAEERREVTRAAERLGAVSALQTKGRLPWTYHGFIANAFWVGWEFQDLYALTGEARWREASLDLARQLAKTQQPGGGWMGIGKGVNDAWIGGVFGPSEFRETTPSCNLHFLARTKRELKTPEFDPVIECAWKGVLTHCVPTMTWQNVGWHSLEVITMQDMVAPRALTFVMWLLDLADPAQRDLKLAETITRWCEDRHVNWARGDDATKARPSCWGWGRAAGNGNMIQARLAYVCARLGQETQDPLWTAKARGLVHGVLAATDPETGMNNADFRCDGSDAAWRFCRMDYTETAVRLMDALRILDPAQIDKD
jgi:hypothetical protein